VLQRLGAAAQPSVLRHAVDQQVLGGGGGLMLAAQLVEPGFELTLRFVGHDDEVVGGGDGGSETVTGVVSGGDGFPFGTGGAGGELRISLIGGDLRGG
jgi:hypothetical protein